MRILVAGGGGAAQSRPLDETFARWVGENGRLLYLPIAMDGIHHSYHESLAWLESVFMPRGVINITMCTELDSALSHELIFYDAIYIGGGNTFRLMHLLHSGRFDLAIQQFAHTGGAVYGGSAGAVVLGRDIGTSAHLDTNTVGLTNLAGFGLLGMYSVWCHYQPSDDSLIQAYISRTGYPVLALSESSGACLEGRQLHACGYEAARVFLDDSNQFYRPGEEIPGIF